MQKPAFSYDELMALAEPFEHIVLVHANNIMEYVISGKRTRIALLLARFDDGTQPPHRLLHRYGTLDGNGFMHPVLPKLFVPLVYHGIPDSWNTTNDINVVMQAATYEPVMPRVWSPAEIAFEKRRMLLEQDGRCVYCGKLMAVDELTLDHIMPGSRGGQHEPSNWCIACRQCNDDKGSMTAEEFQKSKLVLT